MITTTIYFGSVKWNNKYTHVVNFETKAKRREWFTTNFTTATQSRLLEREQGRFETDILSYNQMIQAGHNYLYVKEVDDALTEPVEWFAFITAITRTNRDTCVFNYEIDYWQTYFFKPNGEKAVMSILDSFIKREHHDRWTKDGDYLQPIWSRTIENIEVGDMIKKEQTQLHFPVYKNETELWDPEEISVTPFIVFYDLYSNGYTGGATQINRINSPIVPFLVFQFNGTEATKSFYFDGGLIKYRLDNFNGILGFGEPDKDQTVPTYMANFRHDSPHVYSINKVSYLPFKITMRQELVGGYMSNVLSIRRDEAALTQEKYVRDKQECYALRIARAYKTTSPYFMSPGCDILTINKHKVNKTPNINDVAQQEYEPKLKTQEFELNKITSIKSDVLNILNENIGDDGVTVKVRNSLDLWNYDDVVLDGYNDDDVFNRLRTKNNNELTLTNDQYLTYINNNRNQIQVQQTLGGITAGIGVASAVAAGGFLAAGSVGLGLGLVGGGVAGITNGLGGIAMEHAKQQDYKNRVDEVKGTQNTLMLDLIEDTDLYYYTKYSIRDTFKDRAWQLFMKQGYLTNEYKRPNLETRYYYNYIQCGYVEIDPYAIPQDAVRKIIESMYLNGVTIWHYRSPSTFKFLDYTKENWEVSLNPTT